MHFGKQAFQQLSGINFIFYYGTTFFANSGINNPFIITSEPLLLRSSV